MNLYLNNMKLRNLYEQVLGETEKLGFLAYHGSPTDFKKFSDEFVGGEEATDQEGPGVYFTTNYDNAAAYGGNLYTAKLNGNFITDESASENANEAHIEQLIRMAEDWESHAQNWGEDPESAIYSSISDMFEYNDNEKDVFLQVWIEYYRYDGVNFVRNMTKLGYDGVVIDRTDDRGMNKHIIVYNPSTITLTDKEVLSEELTYRHADTEGPEDDEYEIGMVKESISLPNFRLVKDIKLNDNEKLKIKNLRAEDLLLDQGDYNGRILNMIIKLPWDSQLNNGGIAADIQIVNGELYQIHLQISNDVQGLGLGYKIYVALINDLGHLYSGKGRQHNKTEIPKIWNKLSNDGNFDCYKNNHGTLCMTKNNTNKEVILKQFMN